MPCYAFARHTDRRIINPMTIASKVLMDRNTFNAQQCGGRACIRGMRIRVSDILEMLAAGVSEPQILLDFPDLESADIRACLHYAAQRTEMIRLAA